MNKWKKFRFFEKEVLYEPGTRAPHSAVKALDLTCAAAGPTNLIFGDAAGGVTFLDPAGTTRRFKPHDINVSCIAVSREHKVLVTVGDGVDPRDALTRAESRIIAADARERLREAGSDTSYLESEGAVAPSASTACVRLWKMDRLDDGGEPVCVNEFKVFDGAAAILPGAGGAKSTAVRRVDLCPDLHYLALGLASGKVILFASPDLSRRHRPASCVLDVLPEDGPRSSGSAAQQQQQQQQQQEQLQEAGDDPRVVTGLAFALTREEDSPTPVAASRGGSGSTTMAQASSPVMVHLFATTRRSVACFHLQPGWGMRAGRGGLTPPPRFFLDDLMGCAPNCAALTAAQELAVGQEEAVFFFNTEFRGPAFGFDLPYRCIAAHTNHLFVVSEGERNAVTVTAYDLRNKLVAFTYTLPPSPARLSAEQDVGVPAPAPPQDAGGLARDGLSLEVEETAIEYSPSDRVLDILCDGSTVYVLTSSHTVLVLRELSTATKLDILFRKHMYSVAISLSDNSDQDYATVLDIYRMYADHLYAKGDFDGAVTQYIRTIGHVEPSYVVRRFLDVQRTSNLTTYLEALHSANCATRDHTTLLLNCYTKLKQRRKLRLFIRGKLPSGDRLAQRDPSAAVAYDVPGLSLGGGFEGDEEDEEGEDGEGGGEGEGEGDAVEGGNGTDEGGADGVGDLDELDDMDEAEDEEEEDEEDEEGGGEEAKGKQQGAPTRHRRQRKLLFDVDNAIKVLRDAQYWAEALYLARREEQHSWYLKMQVEDLQQHAKALRYVWSLRLPDAEAAMRMYGKTLVRALPDDATSLLMALCTHYSPRSLGMEEAEPEDKSGLHAASPDQFIHCYVDHPDRLQRFLQYVVDEDTASAGGLRSSVVHETGADLISLDMLTGGSAAEPAASANGSEARSSLSKTVWNTLLELYLRPREDDDEPVAPSAAPTPGGVTHRPRTRREERERTALELLQNPRAAYDVNHALVLVQGAEFKPGQLYLYERLQMYHMVIQHHLDAGDMDAVVKTCRRHGTKDPNLWIQVLSVMATRPDCPEEDLRGVLAHIDRQNLLPPLQVVQVLSENRSLPLRVVKDYLVQRLSQQKMLIEEDEAAIHKYEEETRRMRSELAELKTTARVFRNTNVELPAVHFLCGHSYNQSHLGDTLECPTCAPQTRRLREVQRQLHTRARDHEDFYKQLSSSEDGFAKVAEYFGKGIFDSGDEDELATPASERGPLIADESHREGHRGAGQASRPAPTMGRRPGRGIGPAY